MPLLKVLIAHNRYREPGGEDAAVERDRALLASLGHEVATWYRDNDELARPAARALAGWRAAYSWPARHAFAARLAEDRPDLVHVHNLVPRLSPSILDACREAGVPTVMTLHNYRIACANGLLLRDGRVCELCLGGNPWHAVRHACYRGSRPASLAVARMIARARRTRTWQTRVDRFVALTQFAKAKLIEAGLPAERVRVRANFVDDPGAPDATKPRSGFLFAGRLSVEKGIATLIEAGLRAAIALDVAGDGPQAGVVFAAASERIRPLGRLNATEVAAAMGRACALVVPSLYYEGFPLVVAEAYAAGLPVIASRIGSLAELVEDGVTGLLARPGDADDLAERLRFAEANPAVMARMGMAARARYERLYAPAPCADRLLAIYAEAIGT
ncbi:MAG: glycosyltransferase [Alphaproteobacteria bacterium]